MPSVLSGLASREIAEARAAAINEGLSWQGARFSLNALVRGPSPDTSYCDCGRLIFSAWSKAGVQLPAAEELPILPRGWHLNKGDDRYLKFILQFAHEVETPQPADLATFVIGRSTGHVGMVLTAPTTPPLGFTMLHCMEGHPVMVQDIDRRLLGRWRCGQLSFYSPW